MKLIVTGGLGFIGSNFIRYLLEEASEVQIEKIINLDLLTYAANESNLADLEPDARYQLVKGDIGDKALVSKLLKEHAIDAVVNFAAESHVDRSIDSPEPFFQTNVMGTLNLLEAVRAYYKDMDAKQKEAFKFLHVSTDEVFGDLSNEDPAFTETTPYSPHSPYSASKAASDHIVNAYYHTYDLPILITNCSNNYGPYQFPEKLIPLMIQKALAKESLPIYGKGENIRDWLHVKDHAIGIWNVLLKGRLGESYVIGGDSEKMNIAVVDTICDALDSLRPRKDGISYKDQKSYVTDRPGHDRRYAIDFDKIKNELNWKPSVSFEKGIAQTIQWYLDNEKWVQEIQQKTYNQERLGLSK